MEKRTAKRVLIIFVYLALLSTLFFGLYVLLRPDPTCSDGIKNQLEEKVDCGGPCQACDEVYEIKDLEVKKVEWIDTATDKIDTVVTIKNPNSLFGASTVRYKLKYLDLKGEVLKETKWQKDFILPQQEKYILTQEIEVSGIPADIEIEFGEIIWKKFTSGQQNPRLEVILTEFSNSFRQDLSGFYRVTGTLVNESSLDLETIKIKVILRDDQNKLLATNSQVVNTVHSREKRGFNIPFPSDYNMSNVTKVEIKPETNIFNSDNYIKFFGITEEENL
jgi:hypothetical protein